MPIFDWMLSQEQFLPHGLCLLWQPQLLAVRILADATTALSYYSIPVALIYFITRRRDFHFGWVFWCFAVFILACGTTHVFDVVTIWLPAYRLDTSMRVITAGASIVTACMLWYIMPRLLVIPSVSSLESCNSLLAQEMQQRIAAEEEVRRLNEELERQVRTRTQQLSTALAQKDLYVNETHHRVKNNLQIILGVVELQRLRASSTTTGHMLDDVLSRIRAISLVHEQLYRSDSNTIVIYNYIEALVNSLREDTRGTTTSIELNGDHTVSVPLDMAVPIGLSVNEAMVNAVKHAFEDGRAGTVTVSIRSSDNHIAISIRDNGIGLPVDIDFERSRSIGIRMMYGLVRQISGRLDVVSNDGTELILTIPRSDST